MVELVLSLAQLSPRFFVVVVKAGECQESVYCMVLIPSVNVVVTTKFGVGNNCSNSKKGNRIFCTFWRCSVPVLILGIFRHLITYMNFVRF